MKKALIVSWYFAPCSRMGAKRFGIMCKYFRENGYEAYVIAAPSLITSEGMEAELEIPISPDHIIEVNMDESKIYFTTLVVKLLSKMKLCSRTVEPTHFWYKNVKKTVNLKRLRDIGFDIVIGTYGPMANLYAARYLSRKLKSKYIADIRDPISNYDEKLPRGYRWTSKLDCIIEKMSLYSVDGIVTVNHRMKEDIRDRYPKKKIVTVYNGWEEDHEQQEQESLVGSLGKYLYFAGTLYEYMLDSVQLLFRALNRVNEIEDIKMIIRCVGVQSVKVKQMVRKMKMQGIVFCLPPVSEKVVREERRKSYINVVFNSINKDDYAVEGIAGKAYEYMHEKAPVLAVALSNSKLARILNYTDKGIGTIVESEIVDFILNVGEKYKGNDNISKFSRQYQTAKLCKFMDYILEH